MLPVSEVVLYGRVFAKACNVDEDWQDAFGFIDDEGSSCVTICWHLFGKPT